MPSFVTPPGTAVVAGPTAAGDTAGCGSGGSDAARGESGGRSGAFERDELNFVARQQGSRGPLLQWGRPPSKKQINQRKYCNHEWYGSLKGSVMVFLGTRKVSFELNLQLHQVSADGSCALYCLLQAVLDAKASTTIWKRLLSLRVERPRLVDGMETLVLIANADTAGCPMLRKTLCRYMLNRAALQGLWNDPPATLELATGTEVAKAEGIDWDQSTSGVWQQRAVAFLAPGQFFYQNHQKVLNAFLDNGVAIVTIQYQLDNHNLERPHKKCRTRGDGQEQPGRKYIHYRHMVEEGTERAVILWPMCCEHPEYEEGSNRNHYHHMRARVEPTSLAFIDCTPNATATAAIATSNRVAPAGVRTNADQVRKTIQTTLPFGTLPNCKPFVTNTRNNNDGDGDRGGDGGDHTTSLKP
jgi:hypothetical protein